MPVSRGNERICLPEGADPELLRLFGVEPDGDAEAAEPIDQRPENIKR